MRTTTGIDSRGCRPGARLTATAAMGLLIAVGAVGCVQNNAASMTPPRVYDRIPVTTLAQQLGMQVDRTSRYSAAMTRETDSLLIMGPPRPLVILNGQRIGNGGGVSEQHGRLMVERGLASQISRQLSRRPVNPIPAVWPPGPIPAERMGTVVLDAGHGGKDPGAPNRYGPSESILVMDATHRVAQLLMQRNVHVILTRSDNTFIELNERAAIANRARADLFVSIHADSHPDPDTDGFTIYIARQAGNGAKALAAKAVESLNKQVPICRGIRKQDFRVLVRTKMPAILIEMGYLTNRTEAMKLSTPGYRQHLAEAIADSIVAYINDR